MRDQQVRKSPGLEGVPQLVFLGAGNAIDAIRPFGTQGIRQSLGAGHVALDRTSGAVSAMQRPCRGPRCRQQGQPRSSNYFQRITPGDWLAHTLSLFTQKRSIPFPNIGPSMDQASLGKTKTNELTVQGAPFSWAPWLTAVSGTLLVFVTLTWLILTSEDIRDFDLSIARTLQQHAHDHSAVRQFFWLVTWVGGIVGLTVLATTGTLTMLLDRKSVV